MFRWMRYGLVTVLVLLSASIALACGGFFLTPEEQKIADIAQHGERIIFTVNGNNSYTAILGIDYVGSAKEFSWIMPVPSVPEVDVVDTSIMDNLQNATNMHLSEPPNPCDWVLFIDGAGGGSDYIERGQTGPYEFAVIKNENPDEMVTWLKDNGFVVTDAGKAMIDAYTQEGAYFLAMKLRQDAEVGDIQPVRIKYTADKLQMAMRMTSIAAVPQMPLYVWIFGDTQYAPENFAHPAMDYASFKGTDSLNDLGNSYLSADNEYQRHIDALQAEYNGQMFVTEYAQSTANLDLTGMEGSLIEEYAHQFKYLTRLRGQMSPDQMTLDPIFAPDASAADVSSNINLGDYNDRLDYWQCSTVSSAVDTSTIPQTFDLPAMAADNLLPDFPTKSIQVAAPEGWQMTTLMSGDTPGYIFAPVPVTADMITAFTKGEAAPPMFVVTQWGGLNVEYDIEQYLTPFGPSPYGSDWWFAPAELESHAAILPGYGSPWGWAAIMLASDADWKANKTTYQAMLGYIHSYPYYLSKDLRHTLFLGQYSTTDSYLADYNNYLEYAAGKLPISYIGFPEGWTARWTANDEVLITPDNAGDDAPRAWLRQTNVVYEKSIFAPDFNASVGADKLRAEYGLPMIVGLSPVEGCSTHQDAVPFHHEGRQGYLLVTTEYVFEVSAPDAQFAALDATLKAMIDTVPLFQLC